MSTDYDAPVYEGADLSSDEWALVEASALIVLRAHLKRRKKFIADNLELAQRLEEINAKLFEVSKMIEEQPV